MIFTFVIIIIYLAVSVYVGYSFNNIKKELVQLGAFSPQTAQFLNSDSISHLLLFNNQIPWLAIKETADGRMWIDMSRWRMNVVIYFFLLGISIITFLGLIISYL